MADTKASAFSGIGTWTALADGDLFPFVDISGTGAAKNSVATYLEVKTALATVLLPKAGGTMTGALVNSTNGAASTPALQLTGTPFTGGSATTTKPLMLLETAGATSASWSTSGTMLGINSPSGFSGTALSIQKNGVESVNIRHDGWIVSQFGIGSNTYYNTGGGQVLYFSTVAGDTLSANITGNFSIKSGAALMTQGTATPEAAITAPPGSTYHRNNSGTGELWLKTSGTGNTGWTQIL